MYKKYYLPIQIFLVLEKMNLNYFFSKNLNFKTFYFLVNNKWFVTLLWLLKKELFLSNSTLIEASAIDLKFYSFLNLNIFKKKRILIYYNFFNYNTNNHFFFLYFTNAISNYNVSTDLVFKNANWLEREFCEMYGIVLNFKTDTRKLLLDYSKNENPMLKDFPCEGIVDVYYNFFDSQINYVKNEVVEL